MNALLDFDAVVGALYILSTQASPWLWMIPGLLIGLFTGALPGLGVPIAMSVLLPLTYSMDFLSAIIFLTSIWTGGGFGTAIPAILINVPGGPSATATCFDGYPMCQQGKHNEALGLALSASVIGSIFSYAILFFFINPVSLAVLKMGPTEMLVVILWGMSLIASMTGGSVARGLVAGFFGVIIGTVGFNLMGGLRGTMGIPHLYDGIPVIPALVGLFAAAEMLRLAHKDYIVEVSDARKLSFRLILRGVRQSLSYPLIMLRGSTIGAIVGVAPGVGSTVANLMSYSETRRRDPNPETYGTGNPKGVIAAESANSSSEGGSMATLLALGIPAGGGTALLLAAFSIHDVTGGPRFFTENKDIVYAIILNNIAQAFALFVLGLALIRVCAMLVYVSNRYLVPSVFAASVVGSYAMTGNLAGPVACIIFSCIGYFMRRYGYSIPAMVVGMFLGPPLEAEALRSYQISGGNITYLLERPLTFAIAVAVLFTLFWPSAMRWMRQRRLRNAQA